MNKGKGRGKGNKVTVSDALHRMLQESARADGRLMGAQVDRLIMEALHAREARAAQKVIEGPGDEIE